MSNNNLEKVNKFCDPALITNKLYAKSLKGRGDLNPLLGTGKRLNWPAKCYTYSSFRSWCMCNIKQVHMSSVYNGQVVNASRFQIVKVPLVATSFRLCWQFILTLIIIRVGLLVYAAAGALISGLEVVGVAVAASVEERLTCAALRVVEETWLCTAAGTDLLW